MFDVVYAQASCNLHTAVVVYEVHVLHGAMSHSKLVVNPDHTLPLHLQLGVELDEKGGVKVNDFSQSNVPSIWAIGDVSNRIPLTPVARMEGTYFAQHLFGSAHMPSWDSCQPHTWLLL